MYKSIQGHIVAIIFLSQFSWNRRRFDIKGLCGALSRLAGKTRRFSRHPWQQK